MLRAGRFPLRDVNCGRGQPVMRKGRARRLPACYLQEVQGVSKRSYVFLIALRFALVARGQNFENPNLYSTWKTALPLFAKYVA